jgi:hypothetical protein
MLEFLHFRKEFAPLKKLNKTAKKSGNCAAVIKSPNKRFIIGVNSTGA